DRLAARMWENRESFLPSLETIDEAIEQARRLDGPVCPLDTGDNVGAGGSADSTWLAHALNRPGAPSALVCLCDPVAVTQCQTLGVNRAIRLEVGGHSGSLHGAPLNVNCAVLGFHDGHFSEPEQRHGGFSQFDQG